MSEPDSSMMGMGTAPWYGIAGDHEGWGNPEGPGDLGGEVAREGGLSGLADLGGGNGAATEAGWAVTGTMGKGPSEK